MLTVASYGFAPLDALSQSLGLQLRLVAPGGAIPGNYWGEPEAGIVGRCVFVRPDTPVHSLLHEACHAFCAGLVRDDLIHTDAGGDDLEECAVCYLQILLARALPGAPVERLMEDMDAWGYSFRLGSTRAWFETDAQDATEWLVDRGVIGSDGCLNIDNPRLGG